MDVPNQVDLARSALTQVLQYLEYFSSPLGVEFDVFVAGNVYGLGETREKGLIMPIINLHLFPAPIL